MTGSATLKCELDSPGNVKVSWDGGYFPVQLQSMDSLSYPDWHNVGGPTMRKEKTLTADGEMRVFRLMEAVPLLDAIVTDTTTTLIWTVPEL